MVSFYLTLWVISVFNCFELSLLYRHYNTESVVSDQFFTVFFCVCFGDKQTNTNRPQSCLF